MSKRVTRLVAIWLVVAIAVTVWVMSRTADVSAGDAMLLGVVVGTVFAAALGRARK